MRMSASMCLILMEMTGAPNTLPFLMMVLVIAKGVGDRFNYRYACLVGAGPASGRRLAAAPSSIPSASRRHPSRRPPTRRVASLHAAVQQHL